LFSELFEFPDDVRAVYTDGSTEKDQTSIGVFWGDGDQRNIGELVKDAKPDSGELHAIIKAMEIGLQLNLNGLAIMTDYRNGIMVIKNHLENLKGMKFFTQNFS
jgi:hypothetical protein